MSRLHLHCTRCNGEMSWTMIREGAKCAHCGRPLDDIKQNYLKAVANPAPPDYIEQMLAGNRAAI